MTNTTQDLNTLIYAHKGRPVHKVELAQDSLGRPLYSPNFSVDIAGSVLEYPDGNQTEQGFKWYSTLWDKNGNSKSFDSFFPPGCRYHNCKQNFMESVFNRLTVFWNHLIDDNNEDMPITQRLSIIDNFVIFCNKCTGDYAFVPTVSYIMLSTLNTQEENCAIVKKHFLNLLTEIQNTETPECY